MSEFDYIFQHNKDGSLVIRQGTAHIKIKRPGVAKVTLKYMEPGDKIQRDGVTYERENPDEYWIGKIYLNQCNMQRFMSSL